jgi:dihydropteroate synthase
MGTQKQIKALTGKIDRQPFGLHEIAQDIRDLISDITQDCYAWKTSRRQISLGRKTLVMGILNVTPDSFSDGKLYFDRQRAIDHGLKMVDEGADLLDIGGESTRPGSKPVTARQEIARVIPVLEGLSGKIKIPISIDTTKAHVAQAALAAGAEIVNDISALGDKKMVAFIKQSGAALILMHMKGKPENMQTENPVYDDVMGVIISYLKEKTQKATKAGIAKDHLVLDPGIGFGKSYQDNCKIIRKLDELKGLGMPVLIGTSRKSFIGQVTGGKPEERIEGTAATVAAAIINGCHIVRVHDVAYMKKVAAMTDAIIHA